MKKINITIWLLVFFITFGVMQKFTAFAWVTLYDTVTLNPLEVDVNGYAQIDNACSNAMVLTVDNDGVTNLKAAVGKRYGFDSCRIDFGYNDNTQTYAITFGKTLNYSLYDKDHLADFNDIDNSVTTTISTTGNVEEEKFCFNINGASLIEGAVRTDPDTSYTFNDASAPLGTKRCFNIQDITTDPDEIVGSDTAGVCPYGSCYFNLNIHANMSALETNNDYTKFGTFNTFNNVTTDDYTVQLIITTATP